MNRKLYNVINKWLTKNNAATGLIPVEVVKMCDFELTHDLDRGGVPDDVRDITHPSVVCVDKNGGKEIWLAATPYPQASRFKGEPYENTCVFHAPVLNNNYPTYFSSINHNPIIYKDGARYNSDCDLFYDKETEMFYAITRKRRAENYVTRIVIQSSKDGNVWTTPVTLMETDRESLCPCLVKVECKYLLYMFNASADYKICDSFEIWESPTLNNPNFELKGLYRWEEKNISIWHGDVDYVDGIFYMVFCGVDMRFKRRIIGGLDKSKYLWIAKSKDGINWDYCNRPLLKTNGTYRSTFFKDNDQMIIYVGFMNRYIDKNHPAGNKVGVLTVPMQMVNNLF